MVKLFCPLARSSTHPNAARLLLHQALLTFCIINVVHPNRTPASIVAIWWLIHSSSTPDDLVAPAPIPLETFPQYHLPTNFFETSISPFGGAPAVRMLQPKFHGGTIKLHSSLTQNLLGFAVQGIREDRTKAFELADYEKGICRIKSLAVKHTNDHMNKHHESQIAKL